MEHARGAGRGHPRDRPQGVPGRDPREAGPTHIELPENLAASPPEGGDEIGPLQPSKAYFPEPTDEAIAHAARLLAASERPIVLAGNGVLRRGAAPELARSRAGCTSRLP